MTKHEAHAMFAAAAFQAMLTEKLKEAKSRKLPNSTYGKIAAEAWKAGKILTEHPRADELRSKRLLNYWLR